MTLLARATWLLRSLTSLPASYSAIIFAFISQAIASIFKAAFFFYPAYAKRNQEDRQPVVVAQEAVEEVGKEEKQIAQGVTGCRGVSGTTVDMDVNLKMESNSENKPVGAVFAMTGDRVPLSLVPKNTALGSTVGNTSSNFMLTGPQLQSLSSPPASLFKTSSPRISPRSHGDCSRPRTGSSPPEVSMCSPRDPSSIVDLYCDDEFALSLEFHPNMVLYPVQGVTSMEQAEIGKIDGSFLSMSLNSTHSSLVSNSGEEESVIAV